jgi:hypothetical protein
MKINSQGLAGPRIGSDISFQRCGKLGRLCKIFHRRRGCFRIGQHLAGDINEGGASPGRLALLRDDVLKIVLTVGIHPIREHQRLLSQATIDFLPQGIFPRPADGKIKSHRSGGNHQGKSGQQPQEKPASHFGASKR